jgi:hypothetical protein
MEDEMRRKVAGLGLGVLAACLLAGCGPAAISYNDGFGVGQAMAASADRGSLEGNAALVACRHQWVTSGPASDSRRNWISGCVAGVRKLEASIG